MRTTSVSLTSIFIASTAMTAACGGGGGAKTAQELADKAIAALTAKDFNALKGSYATPDLVKANCPDLPAEKAAKLAEELAEEVADAEKDFKKCVETDWTGAKVTNVSGGDVGETVEGCSGVHEVKDIKLAVEVGGKKMEVKINDPVKIGDMFFMLEGMRCKAPEVTCDDVYDNLVKVMASATDARESEKEMFSGKPEKKSEFNTICSQMQGDTRFKAVLECMAAAASYADTKACEDKAKADAMKEAGEPAVAPTEPTPAPAAAPAPEAPTTPPPAGAPTAPAAAGSGDDMCAKYIAKMTACSEAMPEAAREPIKKALDQVNTSLAGQPDEAKKMACQAGLNAAKQSMGALCPAVVWE